MNNRLLCALLACVLMSLGDASPAAAGEDDWADSDYTPRKRADDGDADAEEKLEHINRADALAKGPTIPLMAAGLYLGGPVAMLLGTIEGGLSFNSPGFQLSNLSGVLLASSLGTSITGGFIANGIAGNNAEWGPLIAGTALSVSGFVIFQVSVQSLVSPVSLTAGAGVSAPLVAAVVAGASCVLVGEILTMSSSGEVEDKYEDMVGMGRLRHRPMLALYALPLEGGISVGVGGRF